MKPKLRNLLLAGSTLLVISYSHAASLTWDANAAAAGLTDGSGAWLDADQWWTGTANTTWTSGDSAIFGNGGSANTAYSVTLAAPTNVDSITIRYYRNNYTLGTAGQTITLNNGITRIGGQGGTVNINSPLTLAGAQTWTNNSIGALNIAGATTLNGNLTIDGSGVILFNNVAAVISGSGNIIKNGSGQFNFDAAPAITHTFTGDIVVNGGSVGFQTAGVLTGRNVHLTDGYLGGRYGSGFTWTGGLGSGANQIRITGGTSGLSGEGNVGSTFQIGTAGSTLIWGASGEGSATGFFDPTVLLLNGDQRMNTNGKGSLNNAIDLNGDDRTITSTQLTNGASSSGFTVSGAITTSSGTAGLTKTGIGNLILTANNDFNGATTIRSDNAYVGFAPYVVTAPGSITLSGANGRISNTSALNLTSGGTLRMVSSNAENTVDRINSAAITVAGGGGLGWENAAGDNSFAETVGNTTVNSGTFNVNLTTNQTGAGDQTLTLGGLTRNGTSAVAFSAGGTGPQASGNKNMIVVTGAGTTTAGQIIGAWATTGTAPAVQTDYAVFSSDYVTPFGATANNDETTWASSNNIHFDAATTLTATRTVNTLRYSGAAATLDLGGNNLETTGLLIGGSGLLTLSGTGALTTPTGGGQLHVTTGSNVITMANPITDNGGVVTLVKSGTAAVNTDNGNMDTQSTLVLNGVSTYTGDTIINGGTLRVGTNNSANGANLGGGTYAGNIQINGGGLLYISTNAGQELSGVISGDGALLKSYSGTLTLSGNNTYTGKTSLAPSTVSGAGTLVVSSFNSVNGGTPLLASSSLGAPTTVANGTIDLGGPQNIQGPAALKYVGTGETTDRVINLQWGANTSRTIEAAGSGLLKFTSAFTSVGGTFATTTLNLAGTGNGEITQALPAVPKFTKNGSGTWTLGGPLHLSDTLTVSAGTLVLNDGKIGAGAVAVNGTSTLGGNGTIAGAVTVAAGAKLTPGTSVGTLTFTNDLNISAMAGGAGVFNMELDTEAASDKIVAGTVNIGTEVLNFADFNFTALGGLENGTYKLITSGGITGTLDTVPANLTGAVGAGTGTLQITGNDIELVVSGIGGGSAFDTWAATGTLGPVTFGGDTNGDGVKDGVAFLLGAADPDVSALGLLPTSSESGGGLVMEFDCLATADRGTSVLELQYDGNLAGTWLSVPVPGAVGAPNPIVETTATGSVSFVATANGDLIHIVATISDATESAGGKLFGRLEGNE